MVESGYSYENDFCEWLSNRVSPSHMSDIYSSLVDINNVCMDNQALIHPLFETTNLRVLQLTTAMIEKKYKCKAKIEAMHYYCTYIEEKHLPINKENSGGLFVKKEEENESALVKLIEEAGIPFEDRRDKKGCLWIIGGMELSPFVDKCKKYGVFFRHKTEGGQATDHKEAWWTAGEICADLMNHIAETETTRKDQTEDVKKPDQNEKVISESDEEEARVKQRRLELIKWMKERKISNGASLVQLSSMSHCNKYAVNRKLVEKNIFLIDSVKKYERVKKKLLNDSRFASIDQLRNRRLSNALDLYDTFLEETEKAKSNITDNMDAGHTHSEKGREQCNQVESEIDALLRDDTFFLLRRELKHQNIRTVEDLRHINLWVFMNQYNLYSIAARQMVLLKVRAILNPANSIDQKELFKLHCGSSEFAGKTVAEAYLHFCENIAGQFPLKIRSLIGKKVDTTSKVALSRTDDFVESMKMENPTAYIDKALTVEEAIEAVKWLCKMCPIHEQNVTIDTPAAYSHPASSANTEHGEKLQEVPKEEKQSAPANDGQNETAKPVSILAAVEKAVLKSDLEGVTFNELKDMFGCTQAAMKNLINRSRHIVEIKDRLIHDEAFVDWDDGASQMKALVSKLMQKNSGYISAAQLYEYAHIEMSMFLNDNDMDDERCVYDIAQHLFEKMECGDVKYKFTGKSHISEAKDAIGSNFDIFCKYAEDEGGVFNYSDLTEYLTSIGIKTGNLRMQLRLYSEPYFLYYDEGVLISAKSMNINEEWKKEVKHALDTLFADVGDHIVLREIQPFWFEQLPDLPGARKWTPLLLQSVLKFYGDEVGARTIIAMESQSMDTLHTMLVRTDSPIQNLGDVILAYMLENDIDQKDFEAEELRELLVNANIIQGNELLGNMAKALGNDERFAWDVDNRNVIIRV